MSRIPPSGISPTVTLPGEALQDLLHLIGDSRGRRSSRVQSFELRQQRKSRMVALQGGDHLSKRLANGGFASLAGDLPRLALDIASQLRNMLQEWRIALEVPGMILGDDWKGRHSQFLERFHHPVGFS